MCPARIGRHVQRHLAALVRNGHRHELDVVVMHRRECFAQVRHLPRLRFERVDGAARPDAATHPIRVGALVATDIDGHLAGPQALANESHLRRIDAQAVAIGAVKIAKPGRHAARIVGRTARVPQRQTALHLMAENPPFPALVHRRAVLRTTRARPLSQPGSHAPPKNTHAPCDRRTNARWLPRHSLTLRSFIARLLRTRSTGAMRYGLAC